MLLASSKLRLANTFPPVSLLEGIQLHLTWLLRRAGGCQPHSSLGTGQSKVSSCAPGCAFPHEGNKGTPLCDPKPPAAPGVSNSNIILVAKDKLRLPQVSGRMAWNSMAHTGLPSTLLVAQLFGIWSGLMWRFAVVWVPTNHAWAECSRCHASKPMDVVGPPPMRLGERVKFRSSHTVGLLMATCSSFHFVWHVSLGLQATQAKKPLRRTAQKCFAELLRKTVRRTWLMGTQ